jgi:hypothetical protein
MLVYIKEEYADQVLRTPDPRQVNPPMVERCDREVRLAEQRRREKIESQLKIRIRMVFESDLCKMGGFWDHAEIPERHRIKVSRESPVKDLLEEFQKYSEIPANQLALFVLQYRNNPRQVRFAFMPINGQVKNNIPQQSAPHFELSDPYLTVVCVASRGYDIQSFKWKPTKSDKIKMQDDKPDELCKWNDEQVIMLIVKYFCVESRKLVTLGCYYIATSECLELMVTDGWVTDRLKPYVDSKEVVPPPEIDTTSKELWLCYEEFNERDIQPRQVKRQVKAEQLWTGDVIVWQPPPAPPARQRREVEEQESMTDSTEGDSVVPLYPVTNVSELALHMANAIDVLVTLHDWRQPLCVDGIIANNQWTRAPPKEPKDPKKGDSSPMKEDRPEDEVLQNSYVQFRMPVEKEIKMDLRWFLHHVTGQIGKEFGIRPTPEAPLWLFHGAPSSGPEEPLNAQTVRTEQISLKDLQRSAMYIQTKKPLILHAVEVPGAFAKTFERGNIAFCVRFYDSAVREVGNCIVTISQNGLVSDIIDEARKKMDPTWGINGALRLLEVSESRLHKLHRPETPVRTLACFNKSNIFYNSLRLEAADPETSDQKLYEIFHCDRQSQQAFAQPILMPLGQNEKSGSLKARCKAKLQVPDAEFKSWRLVRISRGIRIHLKDEEPWDTEWTADSKLCLEHVHPNPTNSLTRQSRYNKPLTIK